MSLITSASKQAIAALGNVSPETLYLSDLGVNRLKALASTFQQVGREQNIPAALLAAVAWTESGFNPGAINPASGATGLMQLMPMNFSAYGILKNPTDPHGNVTAGALDLKAKGYGEKSLLSVMMGYNGFRSIHDPVKLDAFTRYYRAICARWAFLSLSGMV